MTRNLTVACCGISLKKHLIKWILSFSSSSAVRSKPAVLHRQKHFCKVQFVEMEQKATGNLADEENNHQHVSLQAGNISSKAAIRVLPYI